MQLLNPSFTFKFFNLDLLNRKLFVKGIQIPLRNKEFNLLAYFVDNAGKVLSRTQILEDVWDHNICCITNTVDVHVSLLRRKLRIYFNREFIKTVNCIGYMFECEK